MDSLLLKMVFVYHISFVAFSVELFESFYFCFVCAITNWKSRKCVVYIIDATLIAISV